MGKSCVITKTHHGDGEEIIFSLLSLSFLKSSSSDSNDNDDKNVGMNTNMAGGGHAQLLTQDAAAVLTLFTYLFTFSRFVS